MAVYRRGKIWWTSYTVNGERIQKEIGTVKRNAEAVLEKVRVEMRAGRYADPEIQAIPFEALTALPRRLGAEYVFVGQAKVGKSQQIGKPGLPFDRVDTAFLNACTRAGIVGFRFRDLRHTAASHMVMAGVPMKTVGEILGHRTAAMTERYSHLTPEHKRAATEKLSVSYGAEGCYKSATKIEGATG